MVLRGFAVDDRRWSVIAVSREKLDEWV